MPKILGDKFSASLPVICNLFDKEIRSNSGLKFIDFNNTQAENN
jgi:hypothetical protein